MAKEPETRLGNITDRVTVPAFRENKVYSETSHSEERTGDLLEDLQREAELEYISDIPYAAYENQVIKAIERLQAEDYPAEQWKKALVYILKSRKC